MYTPLNYNELNCIEGHISPSTAKNRNNKSYDFWIRQLFFRVLGNLEIDFNNIFSTWAKNFILYVTFIKGFSCFAESEKEGLFGQWCTLSGRGFYYQPTKAIVTNPSWNSSREFTIDEDCVIVRCLPDCIGIYDVLDYYAEKLSLLDNAINMSLINSKFAHIIGGKNKSAVYALKTIFDKVNKGESSVFYDKKISDAETGEPFQFLELFDKNKYISDLLLADFETIMHNFDTEIGIKTIPYNKKERLITAEANAKENESNTKLQIILNTMNEDFAKVNKMFNVNFSIKAINSPDDSEVLDNE